MEKQSKKGFTIVELVVVIAVIALLIAIIIPTFVSLSEKANVSRDAQLCRMLNEELAVAGAESNTKVFNNYNDVLSYLGNRHIVENLTPTSTGDIVWDSNTNRFSLISGNEFLYVGSDTTKRNFRANQKNLNLWTIVSSIPNIADQKYSMYLRENANISSAVVSVGFDAGKNTKLVNLQYVNDGAAQDVIIRTNGGHLIINDTNNASHQYHYGSAASLDLATGNNCYEGHAIVGSLKVTAGKAIADTGSYIGLVESATGVTLVESNNGVFVIPENADASKIPGTVASQIGYTIEGETITPSAEKVDKSYYVIASASDLTDFVARWNAGDEAAKLIKSIKFVADVVYDYSVNSWTPLGTWDDPFNGVIDGMGCSIKGMGIVNNVAGQGTSGATSGISGEAYGLIGIAGGGDVTVTNIKFVDLTINHSEGNMVGAVIGFAPSNQKFQEKSKWVGNTVIGTHNVTITDVTVSGSIVAKQDAAGIAGKLYNTGRQVIKDCTNNASITVTTTNTGYGRAGGIVAMASGSQSLLFENCVNTGSVSSVKFACGIVGYLSTTTVTVTNCSNEGSLSGNSLYVNDIWNARNKTGEVNITIN